MAGGFGNGEVAELMDGSEWRPPRDAPARRPWLWALGGAVVASAVWAGGLFAYERGRDEGIDIKGYAVGSDICVRARLPSLAAALGPSTMEIPWVKYTAPLDRARCDMTLAPKGMTTGLSYDVSITVDLHKKTDPVPEFEAMRDVDRYSSDAAAKVEEVPGLGDKAYMLTTLAADSRDPELRVRDGGAVFRLVLGYGWNGNEGEKQPKDPTAEEIAALQPAMIEDMRALMAALKT
ncbi:hypothetical protein GCM10009612_11720 [Streptomyces beijiangensis]